MVTKAVEQWESPNEFLRHHRNVIGRTTLYERLRDGTIPSVRLGRKILIPSNALERLLENTVAEK